MKLILKSKNNKLVSPRQMQCGEIGEIVEWSDESCVGEIVQKFKQDLISIGRDYGESYSGTGDSPDSRLKIRLLDDGELLINV